MREALRQPLLSCAEGALPVNVALMRLVLAAESQAELEAALAEAAAASPALRRAQALWSATPQAWARLRAVAAAAEAPEADWAGRFDQACALSPEASVALYSLGRADLLRAATDEIIAWLEREGLLRPEALVLDLGCGIGRLLPGLAARVRLAVGLEVSPVMLAEAARRCADGAGAVALLGTGRDLALFREAAFDLVLAVDSFPYLVAEGEAFALQHGREAGRVLKAGGTFVILNYSYQGDPGADDVAVAHLAEVSGLRLLAPGPPAFRHWDGRVYRLVKPAGTRPQPED